HGEAAKPGILRDHVWKAIGRTLELLVNHPECGKEYLEACRFAFVQGDIQPDLFHRAVERLDSPIYRNSSDELEIVNGALKLILENPHAYPTNKLQPMRSAFIEDLQHNAARLVAEQVETHTNVPPPSLWKQSMCLLDL